jgi:hypothetical protein
MNNNHSQATSVKTVDIDSIEDLFPGAGAEAVVTPSDPKKSVLTSEEEVNLDPKDLDQHTPETGNTQTTPDATATTSTDDSTATDADEMPEFGELVKQNEEENKAQGRSKTDKSGIVELYKKKIAAGDMVPFDDFGHEPDEEGYEQKLEEYLSKLPMKDLEELWDANKQRIEASLQESVPQEFFESLPQELQFAAKYVADGGKDLKSLFRALAQVEEVRDLDPVKDAREVSYQYLKATNFGTDEEINEQLDEWEDLKVIEKKSSTFKPKLDKMQETIVQNKLAEQEQQKIARQEAARQYVENVEEALKTPELAGVKLDRKTHDFLVQGLLNPAYPSISGKPTNLLGHLLEQHQVVKPNYPLIAEALWLLADPEGYRTKIKEQGANKKVEETVRQLKSEQNRKQASGSYTESDNTQRRTATRVTRPGNVLRRN